MAEKPTLSDKYQASGMPLAEAIKLLDLVAYQDGAIVSFTFMKKYSGTITLFAFDADQALSEHTTSYDAVVQVLEGNAELTVGDKKISAQTGQAVLIPSDISHAVHAKSRFKMMLTVLR
jgi:quercetin dioxygenase-like cupin family protein